MFYNILSFSGTTANRNKFVNQALSIKHGEWVAGQLGEKEAGINNLRLLCKTRSNQSGRLTARSKHLSNKFNNNN